MRGVVALPGQQAAVLRCIKGRNPDFASKTLVSYKKQQKTKYCLTVDA